MQVNLKYSPELCANLTQDQELQTETQEYVAGVQAYNEILQRLPSIIFIMLAGPLSDSYGRIPLLILPLFGFFILNLVLLINAIWFHELKVGFNLKM